MPQCTYTAIGNLAADPIVREVGEGNMVTKFRMCAHRNYKDVRGGTEEWKTTDQLWLNVECWGDLARSAGQSLRKGMSAICVGTLITHQWEDPTRGLQSRIILKASSIGPDLSRYLANTAPISVSGLTATQQVSAPIPGVQNPNPKGSKLLDDLEKEFSAVGAGVAGGDTPARGEPPF